MAAPEAIPGIPLAKALQATAGAGFMFYFLTALVIVLARMRLRRSSPERVRANTWTNNGSGRDC
jgi:hypothetical protein